LQTGRITIPFRSFAGLPTQELISGKSITPIECTVQDFVVQPVVYPRGVFANWGTFITAISNK
jgi:hypothetical protein